MAHSEILPATLLAGALAHTCMMYAQAAAKHLAQAPDLRQLPVAAAQARECALAEDVHLHMCMMSLADGG